MWLARFAIALLATPLLLTLQAETAAAAPPSNDTFAGATPATLGFSEQLDTREATTDADDAQLNATCGAPATDASMWYAFTTTVDTRVAVDVAVSSYGPTVLVGVGTQGNLQTVECGPLAVAFFATAGTTYYVLVVDDQFDGGGNGGTLSIALYEASPPPTVEVTVDPVSTFNPRTGVATITGTFTCENGLVWGLSGEARQDVGPFTVLGNFAFGEHGLCSGMRSWSAEVFPEDDRFVGGEVITVTFAFSCDQFECAEDYEEQTVQLRGGRP
jgi:hypothetical protein